VLISFKSVLPRRNGSGLIEREGRFFSYGAPGGDKMSHPTPPGLRPAWGKAEVTPGTGREGKGKEEKRFQIKTGKSNTRKSPLRQVRRCDSGRLRCYIRRNNFL